MDTNDVDVQVGSGYPVGQLAKAFFTAATNEDPATRDRAQERARRWSAVLAGMASGQLTIGSRTPVEGLPAWVTPQVVRGGFATGTPAAGGPLRPHELDLAERTAIPAERGAVFAWYLREEGLSELWSLLRSGDYRVEQPEQAALLAVAWLLQAGDRDRALALLDEIGPYGGQLCFAPVPDPAAAEDTSAVWRETASEVGAALRDRRENARVEAMREALTVWNPFADELLELWLETRDSQGHVAGAFPPGWHERAEELMARYQRLAARHTRCGKHRRPKENLAILRAAVQEVLAGRQLTPRTRGLLRHAVEAMLSRRGRPGSPEHAALRATQARIAAMPGYHQLARVVVARLAEQDPDAGLSDCEVEEVCAPVTAKEAAQHGVPVGTAIPQPIRRVVIRAIAGTVPELVGVGVVPSAEVLAELVSQIATTVIVDAYPDAYLRMLATATHRAFRRRRSLLLVDLQHQVRPSELPWIKALEPYRSASPDSRRDAWETAWSLGVLALDEFPGTLLPNRLVRELTTLTEEAGEDLPWVEELAADIFMGRFSTKYLRAAQLAGQLLTDSLYARYYDIDYLSLPAIPETAQGEQDGAASSEEFDTLCRQRARAMVGSGGGGSWVAAKGTVIEQAQILTTHNLATLVKAMDIRPCPDWVGLAQRTFATVLRLAGRLDHNPRPLRTIKNMAYAWRQMIFYLSVADAGDSHGVIDQFHADLAEAPDRVRQRVAPALIGLGHIAAGGRFVDERGPAGGQRLLGWTTGRHWLQETDRRSS